MSKPSYQSLIDERDFNFGSVWKVADSDVSIPQADKRKNVRKVHQERWVVVISNNNQNYNPVCPIVTVAPLSSRTDLKKKFDLELYNSRDNVKLDSLLQLQLSQPILKVDLFDLQGEISQDAKDELLFLIEDYFGLTYED
ncbi:hypothetical protein HMPREF1012_01565 [Bacillus sp. BT1B_CT2]|uniref:type II toxin-antitoxin system PemK/MazF family toxin n=1 Tax=Bacillus TaxID=1386 RepID=UPI0001F44561|nr:MULTISPECIES: type II toxin-antitoxin system PemK/MazF family toxin [Bacillus]EFV72847.1 hypothetical protein HMPREF1012_01565 [Bacillus sp. BT1B_CT2]MBU8800448.1 type II toxin-antitoxin system PemK/MazF family toxin [Bacillus licheniformis]MEC3834163.1 type II toxin-antitoxin system PemK/MazF family toxin [Bacillus licheniformis]MED1082719.1 type II toxin-antitoxin system PemK/MazF family toxin [Bacillus licheniformis]QEO06706.1 hypothetical protein FLQ07_14600 [Bacillus paralicheniformis]